MYPDVNTILTTVIGALTVAGLKYLWKTSIALAELVVRVDGHEKRIDRLDEMRT